MLKASALYIVIIIALVIAVLCSALVLATYFFREQSMVKSRYDRLQNNLSSGIHILLTSKDTGYKQGKNFSLYGNSDDFIRLKNISWGVYDISVAEAFQQRDTVYKVFSTAFAIDSAKWGAIYLVDEDRPLSVSGKTMIRGDVFLPQAGVKPAYVDNKAYEGDKRLVQGKVHDSQRTLPPLQESRIGTLEQLFNQPRGRVRTAWQPDTLKQSFRSPTLTVNLGPELYTLQHSSLSGNIILYSDTLLTIDSSAKLDNIMVFAKAILVKKGFSGRCQLFATDSISLEADCRFTYPSCLGLMCFKAPLVGFPAQLNIGPNSRIAGCIFTYEKEKSALPPSINLAKGAKVTGQVYALHMVSTKDSVSITGSVFAGRFMYQTAYTRYENYLINLHIDARALSSYYLTSELFPVASSHKKILQWLEVK